MRTYNYKSGCYRLPTRKVLGWYLTHEGKILPYHSLSELPDHRIGHYSTKPKAEKAWIEHSKSCALK